MRQSIFIILICHIIFNSCVEKKSQNNNAVNEGTGFSTLVEISETNPTPTVDIENYKLISDSKKDRKADAEQILKVKRRWPLAMQSRKASDFDSILSKNFTFKSRDRFYNRADYIKDRTREDEWKITFVKYDNITLQFFANMGILSYVNHITNKNVNTGAIEYEHISWVDIYIIEEGKWKISAAHSIDYRLEVPDKQ